MKMPLFLFALMLTFPFVTFAQGNTWKEATALNNGATVSGTLTKDNQDHWYKLELSKDGEVSFNVTTNGENAVEYMRLYYSEGETIKEGDRTSINEKTEVSYATGLLAGTYYLRLHRNKTDGQYTVNYTYSPTLFGDDQEPNDEWKTAQKLENGQTVQGHLGFWRMEKNYLYGWRIDDGADYFKIEVPKEGRITLDFKCDETLVADLLELRYTQPSGTSTAFRTSINPSKVGGLLIEDNVLAGTYYVYLRRSSGSFGGYSLKYSHTAYNCEPEPNNDYEHAIEIKDGETIRGHFGSALGQLGTMGNYREAFDWYKVTVQNGRQATLSFTPENEADEVNVAYTFYKMENGEIKKINSGNAHFQSFIVETPEGQDGTYYLEINGMYNPGFYTLTCGIPERSEDSKIRVHYIGRNQVRLGVPTPFQVKVENLDSKPSGSFFLVVPASDDVKLLYAECPSDTGKVHYTMDDLGGSDVNCATFIVPNLDPYESYTFTMYAEGRVNGKTYDAPALAPKKLVLTGTMIAVGTYVGSIAISMGIDKVSEYLTEKANKKIMPEENLEHYARIYSHTVNDLKEKKEEYNIATHALKTMAKNAGENVVKAVPGGTAMATTMNVTENVNGVAGSIRRWFLLNFSRARTQQDVEDFMNEGVPLKNLDTKLGANQIVRSFDPNEMVGPIGAGDKNYIGETRTMDYRILFENKKEATAPAYRIRISDELDENVFDVSTVRFGETSHDGPGYNWKMTREGNKLSWDIEGIELPPNVNAPEGEGYVSFSVNLKPGLKSGTQLKNKAAIVFDYNETIWTNEYVNTLDLVAPEATIVSHSAVGSDSVMVRCTGNDAESGISHYVFYASVDGGEYQHLGESMVPEFSYKQDPNTAVNLKVYAVDNVGNMQADTAPSYTVGIKGIAYHRAAPNGWAIYQLNGSKVASGKGIPALQLPAGIYIVREGGKARKVVVK